VPEASRSRSGPGVRVSHLQEQVQDATALMVSRHGLATFIHPAVVEAVASLVNQAFLAHRSEATLEETAQVAAAVQAILVALLLPVGRE